MRQSPTPKLSVMRGSVVAGVAVNGSAMTIVSKSILSEVVRECTIFAKQNRFFFQFTVKFNIK